MLVKDVEFSETLESLLFPPSSKINEDRIQRIYDIFIKNLVSTSHLFNKRTENIKKKFKPTAECEEAKTDSTSTEETKEEKASGIIAETNEESKKKWASHALSLNSPFEITTSLKNTIHSISKTIQEQWKEYLDLVMLVPHQLAGMLLENFNKTRAHTFKQFVRQVQMNAVAFPFMAAHNVASEHQSLAKVVRSEITTKFAYGYSIKELSMFGKIDEVPVLFEEVFTRSELPLVKSDSGKYEGNLFIFVHGFQATSLNMRTMKNVMLLRFPEIQTLCASSNDEDTEGNIETMAGNLANEISTHIKKWLADTPLHKIFFFGHSLGGIIIRAALPRLGKYKDKMQTFITFSTPHLGCLYQSSKLIGAGMWLLKKWNTSKSLEQLEMSDSKTLTETFMYKLSLMEGLGWFKNVVLVSSFLDQYSPYESARIEIGKKHESNAEYVRMANNILSQIKAQALHRIDVGFNIKKSTINSFIGREAHLQFLENETLLKLLAYRYASTFLNCWIYLLSLIHICRCRRAI
eukprot:TRINITY_DN5345_c0_g2_i2.p1 TRINITY_DN5345_c0_g2~~TRINITY_DN5345_c0_g2_i2.p1  ORF type:complete len:520 (-),score=95.69 TRINITY_DN5345_c0_g2_i2:50-1609(-)